MNTKRSTVVQSNYCFVEYEHVKVFVPIQLIIGSPTSHGNALRTIACIDKVGNCVLKFREHVLKPQTINIPCFTRRKNNSLYTRM